VAPGDAGELWIRSPGNAIGYWENPEATCASFVSGYWRSGDIGTIDADGYVYVFDRLKDMIVRGGFKVYCVELENELLAYPGVVEAAVVPSPCPVLGERIHAFLCVDREIAPEAVRAYCRERLADYKTPDYITYGFETLPRNLNGKIVKQPLRERARAMANSAQ
jgi:O-succinylbenzoic acid--CoA ligase